MHHILQLLFSVLGWCSVLSLFELLCQWKRLAINRVHFLWSFTQKHKTQDLQLLFHEQLVFNHLLSIILCRYYLSLHIFTSFIFTGALYGGLAAIQTIFAFFGSIVFNAIYKNTVHTNKRIFLIFIIALFVVTLILSM